ncbi:alpha/beta fold hydrolase [Streptomyces sp. NBC_00057]|uniref:alpha/beta fold hydrolase n=1 Tax=Streptomyces sp. NBC_00057 TaxID=2975634 RepID=UPI0032453D4D
MRGRPALVLVHSPLVGALTWQPVAKVLHARGHVTIVPSLAKVFGGTGPYYPRLAAAVAKEIDRHKSGRQIVLVGHSGAGALLPAITSTTTTTVVGTIFVDALLPHPGLRWFDTAPVELREHLCELALDGRLPPWNGWFPPGTVEALLPDPHLRARFCAELPNVPLAYFEEPAPAHPGPTPSRSAYLQLSDAYEAEALQAKREGWRVSHRTAHHLTILTEPQEISAALEELIDGRALTGSG